jgi:hypothetical protein
MKGTFTVIGVGAVIIIGVVLLFALGILGRGCGTASKMADQTVFNADKNVWSYEEFHKKYEQYTQYTEQIKDAEARRSQLEAKNVTSGQEYDNINMEISGARQMMRRIASDYNAMSAIAYQKVRKSKNLPEKLE